MRPAVVSRKTDKVSSPIFALRAKLAWQKMAGMKESMQETRIRLADAYFARGVDWKKTGKELTGEILSNLDPCASNGLAACSSGLDVATSVALEKFVTWRAAVLFSKAAGHYTAAQKFSEAGGAWEDAAGCRQTLALFARFEPVLNFNLKKAAAARLKAGEAYRQAGDAEKSEAMLNIGMRDASFCFADVPVQVSVGVSSKTA